METNAYKLCSADMKRNFNSVRTLVRGISEEKGPDDETIRQSHTAMWTQCFTLCSNFCAWVEEFAMGEPERWTFGAAALTKQFEICAKKAENLTPFDDGDLDDFTTFHWLLTFEQKQEVADWEAGQSEKRLAALGCATPSLISLAPSRSDHQLGSMMEPVAITNEDDFQADNDEDLPCVLYGAGSSSSAGPAAAGATPKPTFKFSSVDAGMDPLGLGLVHFGFGHCFFAQFEICHFLGQN